MPVHDESLYDVLGVAPTARLPAIKAAYERIVAEYRKDTTPPDPRREALVQTAWETFLDPARRAEYDASLATRVATRKTGRVRTDTKRIALLVAGAFGVLAVGGYFVMRKPAAPPPPPAHSEQEILADIARTVGRVQVIEMSGSSTTVGLAFAIGGRVMATTCSGLVANAQIVVTVEERDLPSRLSIADEELGICKLAVDTPGTWAITFAAAEPRAGDRVFIPAMNAQGQLTLAEGSVKGFVVEPRRRLIELTAPGALTNGAPVLDTQGKLVGVVTVAHDYGAGRNLALPAALVPQAQSRSEAH